LRRLVLLIAAIGCLLPLSAIPAELPEQSQYYSIQFTAIPVAHKERGLTLYNNLKTKGYFVYFFKTQVKGADWMRLKAGLFPTVTQAKEFGAHFKRQEGYDFFVANADVRIHAVDADRQIIMTPNALWEKNHSGYSELRLISPESIEPVDVLQRMEIIESPDGAHLICRLDSREYTLQLEARQTVAEQAESSIKQDEQAGAEQAESSIEQDEGDAQAFFEQGFSYYKKENLKQAKTYLDKALRTNPQHTSAYYYRGVVHYRQGNYDQAIEDCTNALKINPLHTEAYNIRALVWLEKGEIDRAIKDCDRVLKIDPQNIAAYSTLGVAWLQKGELEWACSDLRKACDLGRCETLETVKKQGYCQ